jgi:long-chain fatty acid transport protein
MKKQMLGVFIALIMFAIPCQAGNNDTFGIGARATALGGAFAAQADDPFALYYNPAGLSWVKKPNFSMGVQVLLPDLNVHDFSVKSPTQEALGEPQDSLVTGPKDFSNDSNALIVPCMGYTMPINDKFHAGFAVYVPWGMELEWDSNPINNPAAFNAYHVYIVREVFSPGISYKINDQLSVGMALSLGKSHDGMEKYLYIASDLAHVARQGEDIASGIIASVNKTAKKDNPNNPDITTVSMAAAALNSKWNYLDQSQKDLAKLLSSLSSAGIESPKEVGEFFASNYDGVPARSHGSKIEVEMFDHFNISYNLGVLYQPTDTIRLGLTYRSKAKENYQGDMEVIYPDGTVWTTDTTLDFTTPDQIQGGIRYKPHKNFSFEMDMVWTQWSVMERQILKLKSPLLIQVLPGTPVIDVTTGISDHPRNWIDTIQKRFGMEWYANKWLTLRLGYFYDPSPVPDDTMDFQWPDADKKIYSFGLGLNGCAFHFKNSSLGLENLNIDLTFQYGKSEYKRYVGGESHNLNHDFDLTEFYHRHVQLSASGAVVGFGCNITYAF